MKLEVWKPIQITQSVNGHSESVAAFDGIIAVEALKMGHSVEQGLVCCDARDVLGIDGVRSDPEADKWWTIRINGNTQNSSSRTKLKDGDKVEWEYR